MRVSLSGAQQQRENGESNMSSTQMCNGARTFAVVIPVGPSDIDLARGLALIASLVLYEPAIGWCVIADNASRSRGLEDLAILPRTCRAVTLVNPRHGCRDHWQAGLLYRLLLAFSWVQSNTDATFVLKIDTDALVVRPFATKLRALLASEPNIGLIGTIGLSCNEQVRVARPQRRTSRLLDLYRWLPRAPSGEHNDCEQLATTAYGQVSVQQLRAFDTIRPHVAAAMEQGYSSETFCQGGAYAMSRLMLDKMQAAGYLSQPEAWIEFPVGEDVVMGMYCRSVGLALRDFSRPNEPFGVQNNGLPYSPSELSARNYSIIHSVKNDPRYTEAHIREHFWRHASSIDRPQD
jgi:hypothetical protein